MLYKSVQTMDAWRKMIVMNLTCIRFVFSVAFLILFVLFDFFLRFACETYTHKAKKERPAIAKNLL